MECAFLDAANDRSPATAVIYCLYHSENIMNFVDPAICDMTGTSEWFSEFSKYVTKTFRKGQVTSSA
jgi:hypothetical protein